MDYLRNNYYNNVKIKIPKHIVWKGIQILKQFKWLEKEERKFLFGLTNVGVIGQLLIAPVRLWDVVLLAELLRVAQIARSHGHDLMEPQQRKCYSNKVPHVDLCARLRGKQDVSRRFLLG